MIRSRACSVSLGSLGRRLDEFIKLVSDVFWSNVSCADVVRTLFNIIQRRISHSSTLDCYLGLSVDDRGNC